MLTLTIKKVCARDEKPKKLVRDLILFDVLGLVVSDLVIFSLTRFCISRPDRAINACARGVNRWPENERAPLQEVARWHEKSRRTENSRASATL